MINLSREQVDSNDEFYSVWYVNTLLQYGVLKEAIYHPPSFQLSDPIYNYRIDEKLKRGKMVKTTVVKEVLKAHIYTADWKFIWNQDMNLDKFVIRYDEKLSPSSNGVFQAKMIGNELVTYIDIKGGAISAQLNSSAVTFVVNMKWVYAKYGIFVQKIVPIFNQKKKMKTIASGLFVRTFTPDRYLMTDGGEMKRKLHYQPLSFMEYYGQI